MTPSPAFARVAPFAAWIACMIAESALARADALGLPALAAAAASGWGYALRTVIAAALLAWCWRRYAELRPTAPLRAGPLAAALGVGLLVFLAWISIGPLLRVGGSHLPAMPLGPDGRPDLLWLAFRVAGTALVVPLIEELFWRSWLMRRLDTHEPLALPPARVSWRAVWLSSAVFALEHRELAAGLLAGLAYAWLYRRHGDLRLAVLAHALTNAALAAYVVGDTHFEYW